MPTPQNWINKISKQLKGRKIIEVRLMTDEEQEEFDWDNKSIVIFLDDGKCLFPSADDEGNNAGAIFTSYEDLSVIPVF